MSKDITVRPGSGVAKGGKPGGFLDKIRGSKASAPATVPHRGDAAMVAAAMQSRGGRPRLVFAVDATASRKSAWDAAQQTTDALLGALPGQLDVALAVHGGSRIKLFSDFTDRPESLRTQAATVSCEQGLTQLVPILRRCRDASGVKAVVYIGDVFEEDGQEAEEVAALLKLRGTKVIVLHDQSSGARADSAEVFASIARITGGAVLPFDPDSISRLRDILEAVAVLAVGGVKLLEQRRHALPGATLLLEHLPGNP